MKYLNKILVFILITCSFSQYHANNLGNIRFEGDIPRVIFGMNIEDHNGTPEEIALSFIQNNSELLHLGKAPTFQFIKTIHNPSGAHVGFKQIYNNIPIIGSETVISINNSNVITTIVNGFQKIKPLQVNPNIDLESAIYIVKNDLSPTNISTVISPKCELGIYINENREFYLVWEIKLLPISESDWYYIINAITGEIILKKNFAYNIDGEGTIWNLNPATYLETFELLDNNDQNYPELEEVYSNNIIYNLDDPINGHYFLRGDFVFSADMSIPYDPIIYEDLPEFYYNREQYGFEEVNCYYHLDKMIRYIHDLGFNPIWNNIHEQNSPKIVFDARGTLTQNSFYSPTGEYIKFGVPINYKDACEDESIIIHELGHALHDALLIGNLNVNSTCRSISEGISDYLGIDYRRQQSIWEPNIFSHWANNDSRTSIYASSEKNFQDNWGDDPYTNLFVWASSLMDLQYIDATIASLGETVLGRNGTVILQLSALSYLTANNTKEDNAFAIYQADIDIYNGSHLREIIQVFNNRLLFDNQIVTDIDINDSQIWDTYKWVQNELHIHSGASLSIEHSSYIIIDANIIIESGGELIINSNANLNFGENTSIEVYGELIINGEDGEEVEFTSEVGDYNIIAHEGSKLTFNHAKVENADRIVLWNQSDETTFTNCTFDNNSFVLAIEGRPQFDNCTFSNNDAGLVTVSMTYPAAMPTVENCTFDNNNLTGMLSGYRSIPILKGNEFINNDDGLRVSFGSEPYLFTNGADCESQNNLFDENNVGVRVYNSGLPWLGIYADGLTAFEGYNRLGSNTWDVYSENTQYPIYAQKNHWQNNPNNLCESGTPTIYGDIITDPTISGDNYNNLVYNAINNEALGDYILAASQYVALVMEDPDSEIVKWAIAGLVRTYTKMNRKADLLTLLDQIRQDNPSTISHKYASTHHITQLIDNGDYDVALEQILELENLYPESELTPKHLFEEWIIAEKTNGLSRSGKSKAQIADKLIADYPEDDFGITMSFIQGTVPIATIEEDASTQDFLPTDFRLTKIYPNPFNPTTNITYEIPEETYINISIYDLAGRKLEDLVTGTVQAGKFNTTLNAEKYPSGVYFVTMTTPNYTTSKKVVLLK